MFTLRFATGARISIRSLVYPEQAVAAQGRSHWRSDLMPLLAYEPFAIYHAGFAGSIPTPDGVRAGEFDNSSLLRRLPSSFCGSIYLAWLPMMSCPCASRVPMER